MEGTVGESSPSLRGRVREGGTSAFAIDGLSPREVISPNTAAEVAEELARAGGAGLAVTPWGGGTQIALGNAPRALDIVLKTSNLNRLLDHSPEDLTATVQAGITLAELQRSLGKHGQQVAIEAPLPERATIGGILAAGATGPRRFAYGNRREQVIGIKVAHPDGTLTKGGGKVVKNVTGYEMTKLYTGSLGTLGVIVEASFKLSPLPVATATIVGILPSIETVPLLVQRLIAAHLQPIALDTLNAGAANTIPGAPALQDGQWAFAAEFAGSMSSVERQVKDASKIMTEAGVTLVTTLHNGDAAAFWTAIRDYGRSAPGSLILRVTVLPSHLPELIDTVSGAAIVARAANGIAYLHWPPIATGGGGEVISPLAGESQGGGCPSPEYLQTLRQTAETLGGSLVIEDAPMELKQRMDVWGTPGSSCPIMRRLKDLFDPQAVLNPGRFIGGI